MIWILTSNGNATKLVEQLHQYDLPDCDIRSLQQFRQLGVPEDSAHLLFHGEEILHLTGNDQVFEHIGQRPAIWFPERLLLSMQEWIRSYELGLEFVPGTTESPEILIARLRRLLHNGDDHPDGEESFLQQVYAYLEKHHLDKDFTIEKMGLDLGMGRTKFYSVIKTLTGLSPSRLVRQWRLQKAATLLQKPSHNVTEVAYRTGFSSTAYFAKCFKEFFGKRPSELLISV